MKTDELLIRIDETNKALKESVVILASNLTELKVLNAGIAEGQKTICSNLENMGKNINGSVMILSNRFFYLFLILLGALLVVVGVKELPKFIGLG